MKTSIYNKTEHTEGYVGKGDAADQSKLQKEYEAGNDTNEVKSFGHESTIEGNVDARDGFDNTGTQGKDSLSDDTYPNQNTNSTIKSAESGTGSSSEDFKLQKGNIKQRDEDDVLNSGI